MDEIKHPVIKAASGSLVGAWAAMSWGERAQMAAFLYTMALLVEWLWKRLLKPLAQRRGWVRGKPRDFLDSTGHADLDDGGEKP